MPDKVGVGRDRGSRSYGWQKPPHVHGETSKVRLAILSLALAAFGIAGGWLYYKSNSLRVEIDSESLCPKANSPSLLAVVLFDVSDQLTSQQRMGIVNELRRLKNQLPRFARLEAFTVNEVAASGSQSFKPMCNPGSGSDMNAIYQNPELARKKWEQHFSKRLDQQLDELMRVPPAKDSPIYEAIQETALRTFQMPEYDEVPKRLIVISDLLQNVPRKQSHYAGVPDFDAFRSSAYFVQVHSDLSNVEVEILYLVRSQVSLDRSKHIVFWENYFAAQGATVQSANSLYGDR